MAHLPLRPVLAEQLIELARLVDAAGDQHGVAAPALQAVLVSMSIRMSATIFSSRD